MILQLGGGLRRTIFVEVILGGANHPLTVYQAFDNQGGVFKLRRSDGQIKAIFDQINQTVGDV